MFAESMGPAAILSQLSELVLLKVEQRNFELKEGASAWLSKAQCGGQFQL